MLDDKFVDKFKHPMHGDKFGEKFKHPMHGRRIVTISTVRNWSIKGIVPGGERRIIYADSRKL